MAGIAIRKVQGAQAADPVTGFTVRPIEIVPLTYRIRNIESLSITQNSAVTEFPLPLSEDQSQILVKIMGNVTNIALSWIISDIDVEPANTMIFSEDGTTNTSITAVPAFGIPVYPPALASGKRIFTVNDQMKILMNEFVPRDINARYHIFIGVENSGPNAIDDSSAPAFNAPQPPFKTDNNYTVGAPTENKKFANTTAFKRMGTIKNLSFNLTGTSPVVFTANMDLAIGDNIISVEDVE